MNCTRACSRESLVVGCALFVTAVLLLVGMRSFSFIFALSTVAFLGCGSVLHPSLIAVSSPIKMQHCMVLLQTLHTPFSALALLDKMGMCQAIDTIVEPFDDAQSFKRTQPTKFGAFPQWVMFQTQSTFGVGGSNNVIEAFIVWTFHG